MPLRGTVEGLPTARPIVEMLPAALQEDEFCRRMVAALDEVIAPVFTTLDCFDAYLDADLAPDDFVDWIASWVGLDIDETWSLERRRTLIKNAAILYRIRGTAAGLAAHLALYAGATPTISDNGGCEWSQTPDSPFPGVARPRIDVRLVVDDDTGIRRGTVNRIVDACRPAHIPCSVEIVVGGTTIEAEDTSDPDAVAADAPGAVALPGADHIELAVQRPTSVEEEEGSAEAGTAEPGSPGTPPSE
jgi:phage tail-like protein